MPWFTIYQIVYFIHTLVVLIAGSDDVSDLYSYVLVVDTGFQHRLPPGATTPDPPRPRDRTKSHPHRSPRDPGRQNGRRSQTRNERGIFKVGFPETGNKAYQPVHFLLARGFFIVGLQETGNKSTTFSFGSAVVELSILDKKSVSPNPPIQSVVLTADVFQLFISPCFCFFFFLLYCCAVVLFFLFSFSIVSTLYTSLTSSGVTYSRLYFRPPHCGSCLTFLSREDFSSSCFPRRPASNCAYPRYE